MSERTPGERVARAKKQYESALEKWGDIRIPPPSLSDGDVTRITKNIRRLKDRYERRLREARAAGHEEVQP